MANELRPEDLGEVWRGQKVEHTQMTIEQIREKARKFQRRIRFRNLREYAAYAVVVAFFGFFGGKYPPLMRPGAWLLIAGMTYVAYQLHKRGAAKAVPEDATPKNWLEFHRQELERQRDLLRGIWRWYLGPMIPGMALVVVGGALANHGHAKHAWALASAYVAIVALGFYFVGRLNQRAAQRLQRQIDELNAMG